MPITTWAALKVKMEQDLADGQHLTQSYAVDGVQRTFRNFTDWQAFYGFVSAKAAAESSTTSAPLGRTYARPRGRF